MRVWVTRAEPGASETARRLLERGHRPLVAPLLQVRDRSDAPLDLEGVRALTFTSRNAVAAFVRRSKERALPVFAVGDATAEAARTAGFAQVASADGDVEALARLIVAAAPGQLLHPCAREPAGDLVGALTSAGVPARAAPIYETMEARQLPQGVELMDAVVIHSPKAARVLARLAPAPLRERLCACISQAAAAPLPAAGFARVRAASRPDEESLLALL